MRARQPPALARQRRAVHGVDTAIYPAQAAPLGPVPRGEAVNSRIPGARPHTPRTLPLGALADEPPARVAPRSNTLPPVLSRLSRGATIVAALTLLVPASAHAFKPTGVTAAPADAQAGANSNFSLHFDVEEPARDLKGFVIHLPPGEVGAVTATPLCTQAQFAAKACPATTQVGTTTTHATAFPTPITGLAVDVPASSTTSRRWAPSPRGWASGSPPPWATRSCCSRSSPCVPATAAWTRAPTASRGLGARPHRHQRRRHHAVRQGGQPGQGLRVQPDLVRAGHDDGRCHRLRRGAGLGLGLLHAHRVRQARVRAALERRPWDPGAKNARPTLTTVIESPAGQANARSVQITLPAALGAVVTTSSTPAPRPSSTRARARPTPRSAAPRRRRRPSPPPSRGR